MPKSCTVNAKRSKNRSGKWKVCTDLDLFHACSDLSITISVTRLRQELERTNLDLQLTQLKLAQYEGQSFNAVTNIAPPPIYGHSAPVPITSAPRRTQAEPLDFSTWGNGYTPPMDSQDSSYLFTGV